MSTTASILTRSETNIPFLPVVCGPTAAGKSGLAIALAKRFHSAILSADSRQIYREFDIGTAKPTAAEQQQVPHYLIDCCEPTDAMTVAEYQAQAQALISTHFSSLPSPSPLTPPLLLVGGTGLYIRAITRGLKIPRVPPHPDLRSQLQVLGQSHCYALLHQVDRPSAAKIHPHDAVRTLRSLEVFYVTGRPMSEQVGENPPSYPILQLGLDCQDGDALERRIAHRTSEMVDRGFAQEVASLCQKYGEDLPLLNTLGYAEFRHYLRGDGSLQTAIARTVLHTRQFAKRQRTWFRAVPAIAWFDADAPDLLDQVWNHLQAWRG